MKISLPVGTVISMVSLRLSLVLLDVEMGTFVLTCASVIVWRVLPLLSTISNGSNVNSHLLDPCWSLQCLFRYLTNCTFASASQ